MKLEFEHRLWQLGVEPIAGVDEAGRGPLAGPVVAAAVILDRRKLDAVPVVIDDSKKLSPRQRQQSYKWLVRNVSAFGVGLVDAAEIDRINIRQAAMRAMRKALDQLPLAPAHVLVDGLLLENAPCEQTSIVSGDARSLSIAAASIIAKVVRDQIMVAYHLEFPSYNFCQNKGYPTAEHLAAIIAHGWSPIHRRSFKPKRLVALGLIP